MKICKLFACLVGSLLGLCGCAIQKMPEGELISVTFSRHTTSANAEFEGSVEKNDKGIFILRATKENYGPLFEKKIDAETMQKFRKIIEEEKMYRYKESYVNTRVLDGWQWTFKAKFSDGSSIYSHGSNARPRDEGLNRIRALMTELVQDGVPVEDDERVQE